MRRHIRGHLERKRTASLLKSAGIKNPNNAGFLENAPRKQETHLPAGGERHERCGYIMSSVISEIRALYRDENDLLRTVIKRVYEEWEDTPERWRLKKIEFLFPDDDLPDIPTAQKPPLSINMAGLSRRRGNSSQKPGNKNASLRAK